MKIILSNIEEEDDGWRGHNITKSLMFLTFKSMGIVLIN